MAAASGYSGTLLPQKLGYRDGQRILFIALPAALEALAAARRFAEVGRTGWAELEGTASGQDVIHGFVRRRVELEAAAETLRRGVAPDGMVWISWPKKASRVETDITEDVIREVLLPTGLVDVKVAAIDATWSGLRLVVRKALRS